MNHVNQQKNNYLTPLLGGAILNVAFFIPSVYANFIALFCIAPVFVGLTKINDPKRRYILSIIFFGAWLIPTTYWYYLIFPWWLAFLQSVGFVFLLAWVFVLMGIFINKTKNNFTGLILGSLVWSTFDGLRLVAPVTKDWWVPHLAYTQWLNPILLQVTRLTGVGGIIFLVLLSNCILTKFLLEKKNKHAMYFCVGVIIACLLGNSILQHTQKNNGEPFTLVGIQGSPRDGYNEDATHTDVVALSERTGKTLKKIARTDVPIMVVWPENMIKPEEDADIQSLAKREQIYIVYNRAEPNELPNPWNTAVIVDPNGNVILTNYKKHPAPGEKISPRQDFGFVVINAKKITADICYDLHYPDIGERLADNDLLLAPVDDDRFGRFLPQLHAADTIFRAIKNRINIITASTNAPTFFVNRYGIIQQMPLPAYTDGEIIVNVKI